MSENERKETTKAELKCEIVRDLLPLYHDGVVSDVTRSEIERHLAWCQPCMAEYESLRQELPVSEKPAGSSGKRFAGMLKKLRKKRVLITAAVSLASVAVVAGGFYFLTEVPVRNIPADAIHVEEVYRYDFEPAPNDDWEHGKGYFINMSIDEKYMSCPTHADIYREKDGGVQLKYQCPLIVWSRTKDRKDGVYPMLESWEAHDGDKYFAINGETVWNAEDGNDGELPGYVHDFYYEQYGRYSQSGWSDYGDEIVFWLGDTVKAWSKDGELLFEGSEDEWNELFKEKNGE
ncbi:MAG: zf-HC2 domain-containing protein [Ruminococcus sp.]|nr:zf-HC2 domain-containing protein [Ruminococcus sp.]